MREESLINQALITENALLKKRIQELEQSRSDFKQEEEKLQRLHDDLAATIKAIPDLRFEVDRNGCIHDYGAPNFVHLYVDPVIFLGKRVEEVLPQDAAVLIKQAIDDAAEQGWHSGTVYSLPLPEGLKWFELSITAKGDQRLPESRFVVLARDITAHKQAEEALRESQQQLADIIAFLPDATFVIDEDSRVIAWNRAMEEMTGTKAADMLGRNHYEYALPFYGERRPILIDLVLNPSKDTEAKYTYAERKDAFLEAETYIPSLAGREVYLYGKASILRDSKGNIVGAIESIRDITTSKQAEKALRTSEEKFRNLVENAIEGIYQTTPDGQYLSANPAFARILGYESPAALLSAISNMAGQLYVDPSRHQEIRHLLTTYGMVRDFEAKLFRKDRKIIWVVINANVMRDPEGNIVSYQGIMMDITEKKLLETQLQESQKLEAIGTLAGGIAHNFNNLLMVIEGRVSMMLMNTDPAHPHYEHLQDIAAQVQSGADLTRQLLGFARGGKYEVKPTNLTDIIKKTSEMFRKTKKEISISEEYEKDLWVAEVDQGQMEQVFMNLYVNAWHAMPGGGNVRIKTENILLDTAQALSYAVPEGKYIKTSFTDTGTGMDASTKERIFDPFFTTKQMGRGTGLGLATVYGIIKGHKGMIDVSSEVGQGTTFTVYLPASEKEVVMQKTAEGSASKGTETILLVDDEQAILNVNKELLEYLGYRVYIAQSGQEAIAFYLEKGEMIDMVILDMIMPEISGSDTFARLKEINPDIRVLLSSGYSLDDDAKRIIDHGCKGFLQKPFQLKLLAKTIREILD